ncbi:hypothetical protein EDD22DRAFT_1051285 [Suillus occidentalis]|nr:hypothetical protein EDD22DRAFT_1051285 [Suillus occidentalis]
MDSIRYHVQEAPRLNEDRPDDRCPVLVGVILQAAATSSWYATVGHRRGGRMIGTTRQPESFSLETSLIARSYSMGYICEMNSPMRLKVVGDSDAHSELWKESPLILRNHPRVHRYDVLLAGYFHPEMQSPLRSMDTHQGTNDPFFQVEFHPPPLVTGGPPHLMVVVKRTKETEDHFYMIHLSGLLIGVIAEKCYIIARLYHHVCRPPSCLADIPWATTVKHKLREKCELSDQELQNIPCNLQYEVSLSEVA